MSLTTTRTAIAAVTDHVCIHAVPAMQLVIIATSTVWLISGNVLWFAVGAVCAAITFLPRVFISNPALRSATALCVTALVFAHVFFGMHAGFYETSLIYDKLMHVLGSFAIGLVVMAFVTRYSADRRIALTGPALGLVTVALIISLGTLWEIFEFSVDRTGLFRSQKGLTDTMLDLIADAAGAAGAAWICTAGSRLRQFRNLLNQQPRQLSWYIQTTGANNE
ncbi:hypothetical protein [Hoeflea sp.]|uniref:hypothetical protein n=1 Tax=Hoeflea sp. TaxID=1940281 RepID=UPI003B025DE8